MSKFNLINWQIYNLLKNKITPLVSIAASKFYTIVGTKHANLSIKCQPHSLKYTPSGITLLSFNDLFFIQPINIYSIEKTNTCLERPRNFTSDLHLILFNCFIYCRKLSCFQSISNLDQSLNSISLPQNNLSNSHFSWLIC